MKIATPVASRRPRGSRSNCCGRSYDRIGWTHKKWKLQSPTLRSGPQARCHTVVSGVRAAQAGSTRGGDCKLQCFEATQGLDVKRLWTKVKRRAKRLQKELWQRRLGPQILTHRRGSADTNLVFYYFSLVSRLPWCTCCGYQLSRLPQ